MHTDTIKIFKKLIIKSINKINKNLGARIDKKFHFKDIVYYSSILNGNGYSYDYVNSLLKIHNIANVSKNTLVKNKNKIYYEHFNDLNNYLLNFIYKDNSPRLIAVDGTYIILLKNLYNDGFKPSKNENYCIALLSTLFDIDKEIPINYGLFKNLNERKGLIKQLSYFKKNDILIMDRGYYSEELLYILNKNNIKVIFRLRTGLALTNNLKKNLNEYTVDINNNNQIIKFRIVRYLVDDKEYYLGTTIYDKNISYFKNIYWKRWKIEIHFRHSKYDLSMINLKSRNENTVRQDILIHNFIFIISSYFKFYLEMDIDKNYKINTANHLKIIINEVLYLLLYTNSTKASISELKRILDISKGTQIPIIINRSFKRIRIRPSSKWYCNGNKYRIKR
jgi:Transposase DDE domain